MTDQMPLTQMTDDQLHDLANHLVDLLYRLKKKTKEFAEMKKEFSEEIKDLKAQIEETARVLREQENAK